jgi:hypothetical protein
LREVFDNDYPRVIEAVSMRHDLMHNLEPRPSDLHRMAEDVSLIACLRYGLTLRSHSAPDPASPG